MKIGIITELSNNTVNYGNVLQSFALNKYLNKNTNHNVETLLVNNIIYKQSTSKNPIIFFNKLRRYIRNKLKKENNLFDISKRKRNFNDFIKNNIKVRMMSNINEIINLNLDCVIVGSDIVWIQDRGVINRLKFLDFKLNKKISYAASFGGDYIPKENIKFIKKYLDDFACISVREKSSVKLLEKIGVNNVQHVCDPTLLLSKSEWEAIEKKVKIKEKYIFVYLLGNDNNQRIAIKKIAKENNLKIVTVPYANGQYNKVDDDFADINIFDCSPENWIYLIHNAEYVFTDSFHGTVFSTIFEKKFIVVKRNNMLNINNRMLDYISSIEEIDKFTYIDNNFSLNTLSWDYKIINENLKKLILNSNNFLQNNIKK